MRLAKFIRDDLESIIKAWMTFAGSIPTLQGMLASEQEDHARDLLLSIANDLDRPQTTKARQRKSRGRQTTREAGHTGLDFNSGEHGKVRFGQGMSAPEVLSEYRALRASVLQLWLDTFGNSLPAPLEELNRFNEAIDQALSQSLLAYVLEQEKKVKFLDQVLSTIPDHACVLDASGRLLYANRALAEHFKLHPDQLLGRSPAELGMTSTRRFDQEIRQVVTTGLALQSEYLTELDSGNRLHEYILSPVLNDQGEVEAVTGTARDITERKQHDAAIWRKANFDALTDLPNRHLFRDRLAHEVHHAERTGARVALLFLDLDHFKEVNDTLGHEDGDQLLQQTAQRLRTCTRAEDTVARLGGDEFTVIVTGVQHTEDVEQIARKIITALAQPFIIGGELVQISGSVGITLYPHDATEPEALVRNADQAMYVAKHAGRSGFRFFAEDMQQKTIARHRLAIDLRRGLAEHEFVVHFQPIVRLQTGQIEKAEALVRWDHPQRGLLLPGEFVSAAEEAGLIAAIDNLVLDEAGRRCTEWSDQGPFQISVNPSPLAFLGTTADGWRIGTPERFTAPPRSLAIEITESVLLQSTPAVSHRLAHLRESGVQIALDDFGTGYASMSYLTRFEVDYLKIDQRFVSELITKPTHRAVAMAIIKLAHDMGMAVIAEGVEHTEQRDWLLDSGCDYAQGFLFAHAVPANEFTRLLHRQSTSH